MITRNLLLPVEITATGTTAALNATDLKGQATVILTAKSTSGSSPTLAVKLQASPAEAKIVDNVSSGASGTKLRVAADDNVKLAAAHTFAAARQISRVILPLKRAAGLSSGTLTLTVEADNAGDPSGTALATATAAVSGLATSFEGVTFELSKPLDIAAEAVVWFVLTGDYTAHATNNVEWRTETVASGGNSAANDGSAWTATTTADFDMVVHGYNFADVHSFTSVASTASVQAHELHVDSHGVLRLTYTLGGTSTPKFVASAVLAK
jgi:hypothetical protein